MKKACDENVSLCGATNGVRLLKSAWVRPAVQLARYILALSVHVCMKFKVMCTGRGWFNNKFEYSAEEMFQFPPPNGLMFSFVCSFISKKKNLPELQEWEDAALVMLCRGGLPYLENICLCDGKLGIIITDMNQRLQGLNSGYKNCGGKTHFLQQRTTRTPQQCGMISWRPEAGQEEQELGGFLDHPPQAPRKLSFHWFMLNGTSLCMVLDLRENPPVNLWKDHHVMEVCCGACSSLQVHTSVTTLLLSQTQMFFFSRDLIIPWHKSTYYWFKTELTDWLASM